MKRKIIRTLDLLVIDEISMVRSDLLDAIDDAMRRYRKSAKPFGGAQLLMIGDLHQLAPVTTEQEEPLLRQYYDTPYFFSSKALKAAGYLTMELQKVYRQQDGEETNQGTPAKLYGGDCPEVTVACLLCWQPSFQHWRVSEEKSHIPENGFSSWNCEFQGLKLAVPRGETISR